MSYNTMKSDFLSILDRDEVQPGGPQAALADTFLQQGIGRIQRTARLPSMERAQLITPDSEPMLQFPVPPDLLQVMDILVPYPNDTRLYPLRHVSYRKLVQFNQFDSPHSYARSQTLIYVRGSVSVGTQLQFLYYGNFSPFADEDSDNELSASTPDLAVYAALKYAGDFFEHPLTQQWDQTYQAILAEVTQMGRDLDNEGGVNEVAQLYHWD